MAKYNRFIQTALAGVFMASQVTAEPDFSHAHHPDGDHELDATSQVLETLEPILDDFLHITGRDTFVLSADRILTPAQLRDATINMDMGIPPSLVLNDQELADALYEATIGLDSPLRQTIEQYRNLNVLNDVEREHIVRVFRGFADMVIQGQAMATAGQLSQCMIVAPRDDQSPAILLGNLAYMPERYVPQINENIPRELVFNKIMAHEAEHCDQERHFHDGILGLRLQSVAGERDADLAAAQAIAGEPFAQEAIEVTKAMRDIGNLRMGADFYNQSEEPIGMDSLSVEIPAHIIFPQDTDENGYDYTEADVVIAAKTVQTFTNMAAGLLHAQTMALSDDPNLNGFPDSFLEGDILGGFAEKGRAINSEYPEIEYAILKIAQKEFFSRYQNEAEVIEGVDHPIERNVVLISKDMIDNYIRAMEEYYPQVTNSRLAQNHIAKFEGYIGEAQMNANSTPVEPTNLKTDSAVQQNFELPKDANEALIMLITIIGNNSTAAPYDGPSFDQSGKIPKPERPPIRTLPTGP